MKFIMKSSLYTKIQNTSEILINPENLLGEFKSMESDISCIICCSIVYQPISCGKCHKMFCQKCIEDWNQRNPKCPFDHPYEKTEVNILAKNLLNRVKLRCHNNHLGCTKEVFYEDYIKHFTNECDYGDFKCCGCDLIGSKKIILMHVNVCEHFDDPCGYCKKVFKRKDLTVHIKNCEEKTIECESCDEKVKKYEMVYHQMNCPEKVIVCDYCHLRFRKKNENSHTKEVCFKEYKNVIKNQYESQNNSNCNTSNSNVDNLNLISQLEKEKKNLESQLNFMTNEKNKITNNYNDLLKNYHTLTSQNTENNNKLAEYKRAYEDWKKYAEKLEFDVTNLKKASSPNNFCNSNPFKSNNYVNQQHNQSNKPLDKIFNFLSGQNK